jgi:ribulose-phosphate 3-epimerase
LLAVDGGVNEETIGACAQAGANLFVTGTALLGHANYPQRLAELNALARSHKDVQV